jgi:hypothetical protein
MKIRFVITVMLFVLGTFSLSWGQALEMAAQCDKARKQLLELIAKPDMTDAQKIRQNLGLDLFDSCDSDEGRVICFQCLGDNQSLRTLQVLQKRDTKRFELLGFGCRCRDQK